MDKEPKDQQPEEVELPDCILQAFARFLVPEIRKFYESEEGRREFEAWKTKDNE